ncbi:MAG: hypothetical protein C5B51_13095 [Terriglobia bacterium]|nr:MAG: hypothetical protein C5B51_13095 [Terriglobia bacterium]
MPRPWAIISSGCRMSPRCQASIRRNSVATRWRSKVFWSGNSTMNESMSTRCKSPARAVSLSFLLLAPLLLQAQSRTVLDGAYSKEQAARGEMEYGANCAKCHEGADVDGPPLTGDPFIDRWREDNLGNLFTFISTRMPRDNAGKLSPSVYRDLLAYLLAANDYPAGPKELAEDAIEITQLVGKDGPKPLPTNALVLVSGCLAAGANNTWNLTNAAEPARSREGDRTTPAELKRSSARPAGTLTFRLQNLDDLGPGVKPEAHKGQKVQAKGVLIRQSNNDRINVTSLEQVGAACP